MARFDDFEWGDTKAAANLRKRDRVLFVVQAVVDSNGRIRIVTARKASPRQRKACSTG